MIGYRSRAAHGTTTEPQEQATGTYLCYDGYIDQERLEAFTTTLDSNHKISTAEQRRRVTNAVIEICQNIMKYGVSNERSRIVVGRDGEGVFVSAEGVADIEEARKVDLNVNQLRCLSSEERENQYEWKFGNANPLEQATGLGLFDLMRMAAVDDAGRPLVRVAIDPIDSPRRLCRLGLNAHIR